MVDAFHAETIVEVDDFKTKNIQLDSIIDKNEVRLNVETVLVTQLVLAGTTIGRQVDEVVQLDLAGMLVQYGAPRFIQGGVDPTQIGDVRDDSILALDYY
jgi:hypothetical protein